MIASNQAETGTFKVMANLELNLDHRLKIVLVEPEIPQNTGNVARLCVVTGAALHLVRPLGFFLSNKHLKRSGMDYWDQVDLHIHDDLAALRQAIGQDRYWLCTSKGATSLWEAKFQKGDWLVFGKETAGLPREWVASEPQKTLRIPMLGGSRCLNLASSAGIVLYEGLKQVHLS